VKQKLLGHVTSLRKLIKEKTVKALIVLGLFLGFSSDSLAEELAPLSIGMTRVLSLTDPALGQPKFNQNLDNYQIGTMPAFSDVIGWWSGRCYTSNLDDQAEGVLLAATETTTVEKSWFPWVDPTIHVVQNMAFIVHGNNRPADYFDNISESLKYEINTFLSSGDYKRIVAFTSDGSINADGSDSRFSIRKHGDIIYGTVLSLEDVKNSQFNVYESCVFPKKIN
jgi:hypothetical protein